MNSVGVKRNDDNSPSLFVDIGANIGAYSIIMAAAGYNVEAFEPMEYNVELVLLSPYWKMSFKIRSSCTRLLLVRIPSRKFVCNF